MIVTTSWISKNYNKYNNLYWNGKLPNIEFKLSRSKKTWGYASYRYMLSANTVKPLSITLSNYYDSPEEVKLTTLLHEMIHIADYTFNPHHFVQNYRKVSKRSYDAHGYWFKAEAKRLQKYGWEIEKYVTAEEKSVSSLSENTKRIIENKKNEALLCAVVGTSNIWYFKTSIPHVKECTATIASCSWSRYVGEVKSIKFFTFKDEKLAQVRSCANRLKGWKIDKMSFLHKLESIKATEIHDYNSLTTKTVKKLQAA